MWWAYASEKLVSVINSLWVLPVYNDAEGKFREDGKEAINVVCVSDSRQFNNVY